jgi:preprotein translocase subunit Sec61beta
MSGSQDSSGLMSSAGLVRYFDAEDSIEINPKSILSICILLSLLAGGLNLVF